MSLPQREVRELVRDARAAIQEMSARSHLAKAWDSLQERDIDGNALWALPYTESALAEFEATHRREPDDVGIVHHLAIIHHARAWDLELHNDAQAADAWKTALDYWQVLASSGEFRTGLEAKLLTCDPDADPALLAEVFRDLPENLIDVHVAFVRHYSELGEEARARTHVELVMQAKLDAAVKESFVGRVFDAQTGSIPEARANESYDSALTTIECFLQLFPNHLAALRMYLEVSTEWLSGMSYQDDWDEIVRVAARSLPYARRLEAHFKLKDEPLAMSALEGLVTKIAFLAADQGESFFALMKTEQLTFNQREGARIAFKLGVEWCRVGREHSPEGSSVRAMLSFCLECHAFTMILEAREVMSAELDLKTELTAAIRLYRKAVAELDEAATVMPESEGIQERLSVRREELTELESRQSMLNLFGASGGNP